MAPRKRARTASAAAASKLTLSGGEPHHPTLASLWRDSRFTDITVCAEGVECRAHRIVLASSSGYFLSLFDSGMRDAADHTYSLEGMRASVLKALLAFVYEGSCEIEESQLTDMLDASARLMVEPLKAACAAMMAAHLSPDNALEVWRLAEAFSLPALEKAAVASALCSFEELPPQLASGSQVLALVQEERLTAKSEEAVFRWIAQWWEAAERLEAAERPEAELMAIMQHVRFATMEEGFLRDTVRAWPALLSAEGQGVLHKSLKPCVGSLQPVPRLGFGPRRIYLVGGIEGAGRRLSTVRTYDPALDLWCEVSSMATQRYAHAAVVLGDKLYALGGISQSDDQEPLAQAEVYDPKADSWQPLPIMPQARHSFPAAAVAGKVYAIGGYDHSYEFSQAVEAYHPLEGVWTQVASLMVARSNHTATVFEGKIYVLGGTTENEDYAAGDEDYATDRVEVYLPTANRWLTLAPMPTARHFHSAAVLDGKIYVSGGRLNSSGPCDVLEAYDPLAGTWTTLASMSHGRKDHSSVAFNGKLYVFGGWVSSQGRTNHVEVYDPASNSWARAADMSFAIDESIAVAL
tara:strand:+ start:91 stop:1824 length:1734 start_codon:yes stop_codon:yes gene_type:complete